MSTDYAGQPHAMNRWTGHHPPQPEDLKKSTGGLDRSVHVMYLGTHPKMQNESRGKINLSEPWKQTK